MSITDLIFDAVIGDVVQMLKDQNLEHQHHVVGFTTGLAFAGFVAEHRQRFTEGFPVDNPVQFNQRIALIELGIAFIQVEESGLWHWVTLIWQVMVFYIKDGYFKR